MFAADPVAHPRWPPRLAGDTAQVVCPVLHGVCGGSLIPVEVFWTAVDPEVLTLDIGGQTIACGK